MRSQRVLSKRELQVLELAGEGLTDRAIAERLGISQGTVLTYWVRIRSKMGQAPRTELVARHLRGTAEVKQGEDSALIAQLHLEVALLRAAIATASDWIAAHDAGGRMVTVATSVRSWLERGESQPVDDPWHAVPDWQNAWERLRMQAIRNPSSPPVAALEVGEHKVEVIVKPVVDGRGAPIGTVTRLTRQK